MTPKDKAINLVDKFMIRIIFNQSANNNSVIQAAKECALLCIDEMQEHAQMIETKYEGYSNPYQYLNKVKEEIKQL